MKLSQLFEDAAGKKVLMSGNEAFARGIFEAGVRFAANYPGTPLSEVGDYLKYLSDISTTFTFDYALNEKVALESCIGASWANSRSVAIFKHLGLNVAADPLHTFPYSGVNAGMLILCGGDPGILSSTNAQDNRMYSLHTKTPIIEPSNIQECKDFIKEGLRLSELYKIPLYIHVTTRLCHSYGVVTLGEIQEPTQTGHFEKDPNRFVNTLGRALNNQKKYFQIVSEVAKNRKIFHLLNKVKLWSKEKPRSNIGIITSGICYSYVLQACHKLNIKPPILKLGLIFPINREEICHFANEYELNLLLVVEELEPFIETFSKRVFCNFCNAMRDLEIHGKDYLPNTGELNTDLVIRFFANFFEVDNKYLLEEFSKKEEALKEILPMLPIRQPTFCPGCQYRPVFYALKKVTAKIYEEMGIQHIFSGDIGCYTLSEAYPYQLLDWVVCMGAGVGIANGMAQILNKNQKLIAYIGDSTFFHTGIQPLLNALKNNIDLTVLIFNNYWTAMTGHQELIATPEQFLKKYGDQSSTQEKSIDLINFVSNMGIENLVVTDAYNIEKLERIFYNTLQKKGLKVIIINEECALEKKRRIRREKKAELSKTQQPSNKVKSETYYTISDSCSKCNECIEFYGCPAINALYIDENIEANNDSRSRELRYYIDETMCVPEVCPGVCRQVCKNQMIHKTMINPYLKDEKKNSK
ncbi:MAG: putative Indolepyruvate oxidoreductase subunit IorA [Promethearchaeota archaeon]|nr:MAG: putative Indolepyruvate oxidoreductase subunit IorA [Candidatus Lokiarchaeota archaeon]